MLNLDFKSINVMKSVINCFLCFSVLVFAQSCGDKPSAGIYGEKFENTGSLEFTKALDQFQAGLDTTYLISGTIENVCQGEGCWISFKNGDEEFLVNTHEKFSMPKNSKGKKATAKGKFVRNEEGEVEFEPTGVIIE
jgi:hypothetical protein